MVHTHKKGYNQGLYISISANAVYRQSYTYGSYNPQTGDIRLNSSYLPSGYYYKDNISRQTHSIYAGAGAGYQWLVSKRLIVDLGYSIQYAIFGRERFQNVPVQNQWQKINYKDIYSYLYFPFQVNIGYVF